MEQHFNVQPLAVLAKREVAKLIDMKTNILFEWLLALGDDRVSFARKNIIGLCDHLYDPLPSHMVPEMQDLIFTRTRNIVNNRMHHLGRDGGKPFFSVGAYIPVMDVPELLLDTSLNTKDDKPRGPHYVLFRKRYDTLVTPLDGVILMALNKRMTSLNMFDFYITNEAKEYMDIAYDFLPKIKPMRHLICSPPSNLSKIINAVQKFKDLTTLTVCNVANDELINKVTSCCTKLVKLDVSNSCNVTRKSIKGISKRRSLKSVILTRTQFRSDDYVKLFMKADFLQNVGCLYEVEKMFETMMNFNVRQPNLEYLTVKDFTLPYIQMIRKVFPSVQELTVEYGRHKLDSLILEEISNIPLRRLTILFFENGAYELPIVANVHVIPTLKEIEIFNASKLSFDTLRLLDKMAPNLDELRIESVHYTPVKVTVEPMFQNLKWLHIFGANFTKRQLWEFLSYCKNIREIYIISNPIMNIAKISDIWLHDLLIRNPMKELSRFYANNTDMTTVSMHALFESCPHLSKLYVTEDRDVLESVEFEEFVDRMKMENRKIDVTPMLPRKFYYDSY